jgi:hypothetical protein
MLKKTLFGFVHRVNLEVDLVLAEALRLGLCHCAAGIPFSKDGDRREENGLQRNGYGDDETQVS